MAFVNAMNIFMNNCLKLCYFDTNIRQEMLFQV